MVSEEEEDLKPHHNIVASLAVPQPASEAVY